MIHPVQIQELIPQNTALPIKLFFLKNLGSSTRHDYRKYLRQQLSKLLSENGHVAPPELLNLDQRSPHPTLHISLSHGRQHSVIAWSDKSFKIGVDIEDLSRLNDGVIARVSSAEEISLAPNASYLWSAKEAALKALYPTYKLISSVEIIDWTPSSPQVPHTPWAFAIKLADTDKGYGEVCFISGQSIAFFTLPS